MMAIPVTLRPVVPDDRPFLFEVYAATRMDELAVTGWSREDLETFLRMQFQAQDAYYRDHYPGAEHHIILAGERRAGRLYIHRSAAEIRLMDLALLPPYRGLGIGSFLLSALLDEALGTRKPVTVHVEKLNRALRLYERLGFTRIDDRGVYWFLEWRPASGK